MRALLLMPHRLRFTTFASPFTLYYLHFIAFALHCFRFTAHASPLTLRCSQSITYALLPTLHYSFLKPQANPKLQANLHPQTNLFRPNF